MTERNQLILAEHSAGDRTGDSRLPVAHMDYHLGSGGHLFRSRIAPPCRGGLLGVELGDYRGRCEPRIFCGELLRECSLRQFTGVVCRFPTRSDLAAPVADLIRQCSRHRLTCYVPEAYAEQNTPVSVLLPTAVSGGSLQLRLEAVCRRFGPERVALWLERAAEDFTLPAPTGCGKRLTSAELEGLQEEQRASVFFSDELCARYFTYMDGEQGHFVLFDDGESLRKKLCLAAALGITTAFLPREELRELLPVLLGEG